MHLQKFNVLVAALVMTTGLAASIDDADARQRSRARSVSNIDGARQAHTSASGSGVRGSYARSRTLSTDGQGNGSITRSGSATGANGGDASYQAQAYRNADGSAGRSTSAYVDSANGGSASRSATSSRDGTGNASRSASASAQGANGGSVSTEGGFTKNADGTYSGGRDTTATGPQGNTYSGSTDYSNGQVSHTSTCTNAAGEVIACR